jgi:hypothetical protein
MRVVPPALAVNLYKTGYSGDWMFFPVLQGDFVIELICKPERGALRMNEDKADNTGQAELLDESRRIRRLQLMMNLVMQVIAQDSKLTFEEASQMVADSRAAALAMFPGKELAYDLLYRPRFQRLMRERFRLQ